MKIKLKIFLVLLMSFLGGAVCVEAASTEKEFTVNQWATNLYYTESGILAGTRRSSFPPEEFLITKESPTWSSLTDEELRDKPLDWILKSSNYTYWGYSILYQDQTTEFFNETSFTYDSLSSLELERGKDIRRIDVMYGDTGSITINYNLIKPDGSKELLKSDYSYGLFSANLPSKIELIGQSTNLDPMVENYIIVSQDGESPFYYEENKDKVINIDLRNPQYTIHFTDELGNKIRESEKISAEVGASFNYVAPAIEGYLVSDTESINDVYSKEDKEFTIVYRKKEKPVEKGKVTVNYEDESGKTLGESVILTGKLGESYKSESKEIAGYILLDIRGTEEGIFSQAETVITYVYQKEAPSIDTGKVIVSYEDESGKTLSEAEVLTGKLGESYKSELKELAGYILLDIRGTEEGIFSQAETVITYVYQKEAPLIETGKVTVNYEDESGKRLSESTILTGKLGESYKSETKEIAGYKLIDIKGTEEGIFSQEEAVVTYIYQKEAPSIETGKVIVNYEDELGKPISESVVLTGKLGEGYKSETKEIAGYKLIDMKGTEAGIFSQAEAVVTYVYQKEAPLIETGKVTVNYEDESGKLISEPTILTGKLGEGYKSETKEIAGYKLIDIRGTEEGIFSQAEAVVTYVYHQVEPSIETGKVIINYEDESGKPISEPTILTGKLGGGYKSESKEIAGYTLKDKKGTEEGIFSQEEAVITYVYKKNKGTVITKEINKKSKSVDEKVSKSTTNSPKLPKTGENNTKNIIFSMVGLIFLIKKRESQKQLL